MVYVSEVPTISDKIAVWLTAISGFISVIASMALVYMIRSRLREQPNCRYLLVMSIIDILQSFAYIATSMALPNETGHYGAIGNAATCAAQGFLIQLGGLGVPCYNASLCIWFLYSIKDNMRPEIFQVTIEKWTHLVSILIPVTLAVTCVALGEFVARGSICWLAGKNAKIFMYLSVGISVASFIIIIFCMSAIYITLYLKERNMRSFSTSESGMQWRPSSKLQLKRETAKQGILFTLGYILTFTFPALNMFFYENKASPFLIPQSIFLPLQGFWNFIIYNRRAIARIRKEYPRLRFYQLVYKLIFRPEEVAPLTRSERRRSSVSNNQQNRRSFQNNSSDVEEGSSDIDMSWCCFVRKSKSPKTNKNSKENEEMDNKRNIISIHQNALIAVKELEDEGYLSEEDMHVNQNARRNSNCSFVSKLEARDSEDDCPLKREKEQDFNLALNSLVGRGKIDSVDSVEEDNVIMQSSL